MYRLLIIVLMSFLLLITTSCGGTSEYRLEKVQKILYDKTFQGTVNINKIAVPEVFHETLGFYDYNLYLRDAIKRQYTKSLEKCFAGGLVEKNAEYNFIITSLDISTFPIASVLIDIRIYLQIEIFDKRMEKVKTVMIYGFGSDPNGNRALEKAVRNSFYQLIPPLEELFYR